MLPLFSAGGWCVVDDGDEEIIELRSSGSGPWREHLAQASSSSSSSAAATATTATTTVQSHAHAHTSHTLPLTFTQPQSQSYAQAPTTPTEAETGLFKHRLGSRLVASRWFPTRDTSTRTSPKRTEIIFFFFYYILKLLSYEKQRCIIRDLHFKIYKFRRNIRWKKQNINNTLR